MSDAVAALMERVYHRGRILAVLTDVHTGAEEIHYGDLYDAPKAPNPEGPNRVTTAGELYYAQKSCGETPSQFTSPAMELGTAGNTPAAGSTRADVTTKVSSSLKQIDATYPKTNDGDTENTGRAADVISWRTSYLTTEANASSIDRAIITNYASGSPGSTEPLLMYGVFGTPFTKTSSQTLKVFVNHTPTGV